jgi:hypothetical protein
MTGPDEEDHDVSMINEMVFLAVLLRRISKEIYHNPKALTVPQKSSVALDLDALLVEWKSRLPEWLNFDVVTLRESESAAKQKLVLHLRYLNARAILHRPFLADSTSAWESSRQQHVRLCLDAARQTILILYESYTNRHYFRTWWYNSTYALYAGMIVLYIIMFGHTTVSYEMLVDDVKKSQDVLQSMEESSVAGRSADLMSEVLGMAQAKLQQEQSVAPCGLSTFPEENDDTRQQAHEMSLNDDDFSRLLFQNKDLGQEPGALFASITDLDMLQDFTCMTEGFPDMEEIVFPTMENFNCS